MNEFEKALEDESQAYKRDVITKYDLVPSHIDTDFRSGARWARRFTVQEIIGYMKINGYFNLADAIQYNFKDRGGD